jgi:hypothetical protein
MPCQVWRRLTSQRRATLGTRMLRHEVRSIHTYLPLFRILIPVPASLHQEHQGLYYHPHLPRPARIYYED